MLREQANDFDRLNGNFDAPDYRLQWARRANILIANLPDWRLVDLN